MNNIEETIKDRDATYGGFEEVSYISNNLLAVIGEYTDAHKIYLPTMQLEAFKMLFHKVARMVAGGGRGINHIENWRDASGYMQIVANKLFNQEGATDTKVIKYKVVNGELKEVIEPIEKESTIPGILKLLAELDREINCGPSQISSTEIHLMRNLVTEITTMVKAL
jgi:hypothetical protein